MINKLAISAHAKSMALKDRLLTNEEGASSVEWILIVVGLAIAVGVGATAVGVWFSSSIASVTAP